MELFATYSSRRSDLLPWLVGAAINQDRNLRMQYLAGIGVNKDDSAAIYELVSASQIPRGYVESVEGRVNSLREAIRRAP